MGVVDLFPFFFGLLILSTLNPWHFPQFAFHGSLSSAPPLGNRNFINRELFWLYFSVVHRSVWVSTWECGLHILVFDSHFYSVSVSLYHSLPPTTPHCLWPLLFYSFSLFPDLLETCSMAGLERGCQRPLATGVVIGSKDEETFPRKRFLLGRALRLMSWQAHLYVPQASGTDEWILSGHTQGQNIQNSFWPLSLLTSSAG